MSVTFDRLPESAAEISALADGALGNPEHTCALFLGALNLYTNDKDTGIEAVNLLRGPPPAEQLRNTVYPRPADG